MTCLYRFHDFYCFAWNYKKLQGEKFAENGKNFCGVLATLQNLGHAYLIKISHK